MGRVRVEIDKKRDLSILRTLSMNGRATIDFIGRLAGGLSKHATYRRIKALEDEYGVRYIAEIDLSKLDYLGYMAFVKFRGRIPTLKDIHETFDRNPHVQLVLLTTGEYDMIVYFVSDNNKDATYFVYELKTQTKLAFYPANWYTTPYFSSIFTLPLRDQFFSLLSHKVWHRSKYQKKPGEDDITEREFNLLKELNKNGAVSFTDLDSKYNLGIGTSRYTYLRLKERGILKRITITMEKLPIKYHAIFLTNSFHGAKFAKTRQHLLKEIIKEGPLINKYIHQSDIGIPAGTMLIMPVFDDNQVKQTEDLFEKTISGVELKKLVVTSIVIGSFTYRRFDPTHTNQYRLLVDEYKMQKYPEQINYEPDLAGEKRITHNLVVDLSEIKSSKS